MRGNIKIYHNKTIKKLFVIFFIIGLSASLYGQSLKFNKIGLNEGLSNNSVYSFLKDRDGFVWFSTQDGLNRYDGYETRVFKHNLDDPNSLSDDWIFSLVEDNEKNIWIGTNSGGLNKLERSTMKIKHFKHDIDNENSIPANRVWALMIDHNNSLWVGMFGGGVRILNQKTLDFEKIKIKTAEQNNFVELNLTDNRVVNLFEDSKKRIWISTQNGLNMINTENMVITKFVHKKNQPGSICDNRIWSVFQDSEEIIWVSTENGFCKYIETSGEFKTYKSNTGNRNSLCDNRVWSINEFGRKLWIGTKNGLSIFDKDTEEFSTYKNEPYDKYSLSENEIWQIAKSSNGIIWILTNGGGVNKFTPYSQRFKHIKVNPLSKNSLSSNRIRSICSDSFGYLWIGTIGGGLNRISFKTGKIDIFKAYPNSKNQLTNNDITAIYEDRNKSLWVGTWGGGLFLFNRKKESFKKYHNIKNQPNSLGSDVIQTIFEDSNGDFWIGTNDGLNKMDRKSGIFQSYNHQNENINSISDNRIQSNCILEEKKGLLWIGTFGGLNLFNKETGKFKRFLHSENDLNSLSNNRVICLFKDSKSRLWIGTYGGGLNLYDSKNNRFIHLNREYAINDTVYGIVEDSEGHLLLSTNNGVYHLNLDKHTAQRFDVHDGLQSNQFMWGAIHKDKNNKIYMGGVNGLNFFDSDKIVLNKIPPKVAITSFKIFGKTKFSVDMTQSKHINLDYKDNFFSFEFSALDYNLPQKNQYAYKMEGVDKDWVYSGNRRRASYTDIQGGDYVFKVKASNNDGIWNEKATAISIKITPPFFKTKLFMVLMVLSGILLISLIFIFRIRAIKIMNKQLEERVNEAIKEIKTLSSFLPICANCKKIRDDKGYWEEVEEYISKNTDTQFSHSICPDCVKELYPEYYDRNFKKKKNKDKI